MKKMGIWIVSILLISVLVLNVFFFFFQDNILFQSKSLAADFRFDFPQKFQEFFIPVDDNQQLNALFFTSENPKGLIVYFHGNADNLQRWGEYAFDFTKLGFDILMIDYRGYGKSTGIPTEKMLYQDAEKVWSWAAENFPKYAKKVIYGRSLGAGVASFLATKTKADLLILETPFDNLKGAMLYYSPFIFVPFKYQFPNKKWLSQTKMNIVIFHGTNDWVVPLTSTIKLKPLLKKGDKFIIIEEASHKNLRDFPLYHKELAAVLSF